MMKINKILTETAMLLALLTLAACGGGGSGGSSGSASSPVGTWGGAAETDTYTASNTYVISTGGCTYTGGTYSLSGNKITVATVPTVAAPSGISPAGSCSPATVQTLLNGFSLDFSTSSLVSGYSITTTPSTGSVSTSYSLLGKWKGLPVSGVTPTFYFNGDGTYKLIQEISGGSCDFTGGKYTASGELLTIDTAPTTGTATGAVSCNVASLASLAGSTNWIQISSSTLTATDTNGTSTYTRI